METIAREEYFWKNADMFEICEETRKERNEGNADY